MYVKINRKVNLPSKRHFICVLICTTESGPHIGAA